MRYYLLGTCLLALAVVIIAVHAQEQPDICAYSERNTGTIAEWDAVNERWFDMPEKLDPVDLFYLTDPTLPPEQSQAYQIGIDWTARRVWVFPYYSLENDGNGNHMLCDVLVYKGR